MPRAFPIRFPIAAATLLFGFLTLLGSSSNGDDIGSPAQRAQRPMMHFRVLWMHDPDTKAVVSWSTLESGNQHRVYYDTESRQGDLEAYAHETPATESGQFTMVSDDRGTPPAYYHHTMLEDLQPATTYYFVVASDDRVSEEFHFQTAPADDRPIKLLFGGDSRRPPSLPEAHEDRRKINRMIAEMVQ